jgi:hypothetical protein
MQAPHLWTVSAAVPHLGSAFQRPPAIHGGLMARAKLKNVSVYATEDDVAVLTRAAELERRSLSNYLLTLGLQRAEELGVQRGRGLSGKNRPRH